MENIEDIVKNVIDQDENTDTYSNINGKICSISNSVIHVTGLEKVFLKEKVIIDDKYYGIVIEFAESHVTILPLFNVQKITMNSKVICTGKEYNITIGGNINHRMLNGIGEAIDQKENVNEQHIPLFPEHISFMENNPIDLQIVTGITTIDCMLPVGFGQKVAILGNIGSKKTTLIESIMHNVALQTNTICIYVSIGQTTSTTLAIRDKLANCNRKNNIFIVASNNDPVSHFYMAPFVANAIATYLSSKGIDVIVFIDSLSQHAVAYREMCLSSGLAPGKEAFPGNTFSMYSDLLEYACNLKSHNGKGSVSFFPVIDLVDNDISSFLSTTVISITDGQIVLQDGKINLEQSVSRVGNSIQNKLLKQYSHSLKLKLARYKEYLRVSNFSSSLSEEAKRILHEGQLISQLIDQEFHHSKTMAEQIIYLRIIDENILENKDINFVNQIKEKISLLKLDNFSSQDQLDKCYEDLKLHD